MRRAPGPHFHHTQQVVRPALATLLRRRQFRLRRQRYRPMRRGCRAHRTYSPPVDPSTSARKPQQPIAACLPRLHAVQVRCGAQQTREMRVDGTSPARVASAPRRQLELHTKISPEATSQFRKPNRVCDASIQFCLRSTFHFGVHCSESLKNSISFQQ